jgi:uncharacterized UPF0160 family protein
LKGKSPEVNKTEALDALEKGISNPATWIFSILNKVHNIGITKTTIPLNYHQYTSTSFCLNKTFHNYLYDKNSFKLIYLYFPPTLLKQNDPNIKDNSFYRNVMSNYFFIKDFKLNILECYDLEGSNNGELVKSFKVDSNKQYVKESSRCSYESVKNSVTIISYIMVNTVNLILKK